MAINSIYPRTSPYYLTSVYKNQFLDMMINRPIPYLDSDVYWVITEAYNNRPDMLAYDLYTDSRLWWVFAQRNPDRLSDPLFDFKTNVGIYLPKLETIRQILGT